MKVSSCCKVEFKVMGEADRAGSWLQCQLCMDPCSSIEVEPPRQKEPVRENGD